MDISFSNDFEYKSAATSVGCFSHSHEMCFHNVPTSPGMVKSCAISGFQTEPTSPRSTYEDANYNLDEFEFETSWHFSDFNLEESLKEENQQQKRHERERGDSMPTMAFADELFCGGKVLPLNIPPLKLPPRLQNGDGSKMSAPSSTVSSPRSPGSLLGLQFSFQSLWKDDFDPFMVALEKVKWEKRGKLHAKHGLRRTRSLSPFRGYDPNMPNEKEGLNTPRQQHEPSPDEEKESRNPKMLPKPKGLVYARHVKLVRMGNNAPNELNETKTPSGTMMEREGKGFWGKEKREKIMKLLFGSTYMGKDSADNKVKNEKAALEKPILLRKLSLKSRESTRWDKYKVMAEMTKMTMVRYKPRLLCLGDGGKYVK
ncbi:hypothetical protein L6164_029232 [Bauhinia variegata]|uniref:Uncharacterized protein n=1 Tax=Bauhinia variegata TaxID=167791 RepID=A0ACB9L9E1_BAUVA|nr:hypothetical protein L6164_029232 [Bauhinia variegata]